ncbi:MAG TPA: GTP 3',8-cyclase MoaA [Desulfopila sp.]|nr:GTP 3',8-cyclase MoaA [Desulfopila sp.]
MSQHHPANGRRVTPGQLVDNFNRKINYLRLSITDRCNLRCRYCCPAEGIQQVPHEDILTFEEIRRLVATLAAFGVEKVRITGGEPFARKGVLGLLEAMKKIDGVEQLYLTTNGVLAADHLHDLKAAGVAGINLSLDTLDRHRYAQITRKDRLDDVLRTFHGALALDIGVKINSVVLEDTSDGELIEMVELGRNNPVDVRFIEQMPFSGAEIIDPLGRESLLWRLQNLFADMVELRTDTPTTARLFGRPGFIGRIGVIEGNSRHFCASCNKVRITSIGMLKTCLYDNGVLDLRALLRSGCDDEEIGRQILEAVVRSAPDGHSAEKASCRLSEPSMAAIGG